MPLLTKSLPIMQRAGSEDTPRPRLPGPEAPSTRPRRPSGAARQAASFGIAGLLLLLAVSPAVAQAPAAPAEDGAAAAADSGETPAVPEVVEVPPELASAQATMRTFLEAFDPQKAPEGWHPLDRAAMTLDLSQIAEDVRKQQGRELAAQLKDLVDKTALIDLSTLSDDPDAEPWRLEISGGEDEKTPDGEVVIAPDVHGRWLFTADTVEKIQSLLAVVRDRDVVEGVTRTGPLTLAQWLREKMPSTLLGVTFLLENWQWLGLFLLAMVGFMLDRLVTGSVRVAIQGYLHRRMEQIDPTELTESLRPLGLLVAGSIWWLGLFWLGLPTQVLEALTVAVKFVVVVASVWTVYRMVDIIAAVLESRASKSENKFDDLLVPLFRKSAKLVVAALGFVFIADNLDVDITSLVAGLGIGGLALALAAQDAVRNLFGSLMVILDQPFSVGDWVKIGDIEGTVMELGFRSTRIRTFYDSIITLPNANLISASVDNLGARSYRRWSTTLSLTYETPAEKVEAFCEGVRELVRCHPDTRKDSYQVYLNKFSTASIEVLLYIFFQTPDWASELAARHRLALDIMRLAQSLGVDFAYPTQTLYVQRPGDAEPLGRFEDYGERLQQIYGDARGRAGEISRGVFGSEVPTVGGDKGSAG